MITIDLCVRTASNIRFLLFMINSWRLYSRLMDHRIPIKNKVDPKVCSPLQSGVSRLSRKFKNIFIFYYHCLTVICVFKFNQKLRLFSNHHIKNTKLLLTCYAGSLMTFTLGKKNQFSYGKMFICMQSITCSVDNTCTQVGNNHFLYLRLYLKIPFSQNIMRVSGKKLLLPRNKQITLVRQPLCIKLLLKSHRYP